MDDPTRAGDLADPDSAGPPPEGRALLGWFAAAFALSLFAGAVVPRGPGVFHAGLAVLAFLLWTGLARAALRWSVPRSLLAGPPAPPPTSPGVPSSPGSGREGPPSRRRGA